MQLGLTRSQTSETDRKGRPTGVKFHLAYQLRVTAEERALIDHYGLSERYVVGDYNSPNGLGHTIERLLAGSSHTGSSTDGVLQYEQLVMKGARNAAALVSQVAAFDGQERLIDLAPATEPDAG